MQTKNTTPTTAEINAAIKLTDPRGFDTAFFAKLQTGQYTHTEAYEQLETLYLKVFKRRRYANAESYRVSRNKRLNSI